MERFRGMGKRVLGSAEVWILLEIVIISAVQIGSFYFNRWLGDLLNTGTNYFGRLFFAPLALTVTKIACHSAGCCRGIPWEYGYYNPISRTIEFPAQMLESAVALLLFVFLQCIRKKVPKGMLFPVYLVIYSGIRFFTEFVRSEPNVILGMKAYQVLCLVGVLEWMAVKKYKVFVQNKIGEPENNHL